MIYHLTRISLTQVCLGLASAATFQLVIKKKKKSLARALLPSPALWFLHKITDPGIVQKHPGDWQRSLALSRTTAVTVWTVPCSRSARIAVLRLRWLNGYAILDSIS